MARSGSDDVVDPKPAWRALLFVMLTVCLLPLRAAAEEVRIGIQIFRDSPLPISTYDDLLAEISRDGSFQGTSGPIDIKVTVGTQKDILSWAERKMIDIAIVSPFVFGSLVMTSGPEQKPEWSYLISERFDGSRGEVLPNNVVVASNSFGAREAIAELLLKKYPLRFVRTAQFEDSAKFANPMPQGSPAQTIESRVSGTSSGSLGAALGSSPEVLLRGAFTHGSLLTQEFFRELQVRERLALTDFGRLLELHRCTQTDQLRIAVVFAGGGAKCSYQVGAVGVLESYLASLRQIHQDPSFDIALAAGTSGGALNALPVSLGVSADSEGLQDFSTIWRELDQRDLIRPSSLVRNLMVIWFVCLQGVVLLRVRRERHFRNPEKHPWIISPFFFLFGALQVIVARLPMKPWSMLGSNSMVHHLWLWLSWGLEGSGWVLIVLGATSLVVRHFRWIQNTSFPLRYRVVRRIFWVGIVVIPLVQTVNILFYQSTLSDNGGIERSIASNYSRLLTRHLARKQLSPLGVGLPAEPATGEATAEIFERLSKGIVERHLLRRDLILTGSALPTTTSETGRDLYFFAHGTGPSVSPHFGLRGVALDDRASLFMDVVMGSGAIYPVFPARTLHDFPRPGERIELVDGSFEHRSPVEAAVLWGATHVLVIQAATDEVVARGAFLDNIMAAMNHLYDQAQLLDFRSREASITVTLTPEPPHIGLLDFSDNLIDVSIQKGADDAAREGKDGRLPLYRKEVSEPKFWTPPMANRALSYCGDLAL